MRRKKQLTLPEQNEEFKILDEIYKNNIENDPYISALNELEITQRNLIILYIINNCNANAMARSLKVSNTFIHYTIKPILDELKEKSNKFICF